MIDSYVTILRYTAKADVRKALEKLQAIQVWQSRRKGLSELTHGN